MAHDIGHALLGQDFPVLFGREKTGRYGIDAHALSRPFARQPLRQIIDSGFADTIGKYFGQRRAGRGGRDIDDAALFPLFDHLLSEHLAGEKHAL